MPASIIQISKDKKSTCEGTSGRCASWLARRYAPWLAWSSSQEIPVSAFDSIKKYVSLCENQIFLCSTMSQINDGSGSA
jgi:hypothetical protein